MQHILRNKLFLWGLPPVPYIFGKLFQRQALFTSNICLAKRVCLSWTA